MKILVTGATGFVGSVLVPMLINKYGPGSVSIFVLPGDPIPENWKIQGIRIFHGNILDQESLGNACRNHTHVIHMAGFISYWKRDAADIMAINRDGVANVVNCCLNCQVKRLIHISSVGAIGFYPNGELADENTPFNWPDYFHYMISKHQGQKIIEKAVEKRDLDAIILNPASIMGPGDPNLNTPHNQLYHRIYKKFPFGSFSGGLAVVDVRDLAELIIRALSLGKVGEYYLAVGANLTYREVIQLIGKYANRNVYPARIPPFLLKMAGTMLEFISRFTHQRPLLTYSYGKLSGWYTYYSSKKSQKTFSHTYIDIEKTIRDSCSYFENTFLKQSTR